MSVINRRAMKVRLHAKRLSIDLQVVAGGVRTFEGVTV